MLNLNNVTITTKLFHTSNIDEWMEAIFADHAERQRRSRDKSAACKSLSKPSTNNARGKAEADT